MRVRWFRHAFASVAFLFVLVGCESSLGGEGSAPSDLVEVTFVAPAGSGTEGVQPAGLPFNPDGSGTIVSEVSLQMSPSPGEEWLYFDDSYTVVEDETDGNSTVHLVPGDSITLRVPPGTYFVYSVGSTPEGWLAVRGWQQGVVIDGPTSIPLELKSVLYDVELETVPAVDYVQPGDVVDVFLKPFAVDGVSPVPLEDFVITYSPTNGDGLETGTILASSELGARVEVASDVTDMELSVTFLGLHSFSNDVFGDRGGARFGSETYVLTLPVRLETGVTTDADQPDGAITTHQVGTAVDGNVPVMFAGWVDGDAREIASINLYEGPKLIASTESRSVGSISFPTSREPGKWYWESDSITFADGNLYRVTLRVVDDATNEFLMEYTLDLR